MLGQQPCAELAVQENKKKKNIGQTTSRTTTDGLFCCCCRGERVRDTCTVYTAIPGANASMSENSHKRNVQENFPSSEAWDESSGIKPTVTMNNRIIV